jgi:hypothetical protein
VLIVEKLLQGSMPARFVGSVVLPAVPDDVEAGASEDADGVWMVVSSFEGLAVEVGVRLEDVEELET